MADGAEFVFGAGGPMPPGSARHLRDLITRARAQTQANFNIEQFEELDEISNPIIASVFVDADAELEELEDEFAARAQQMKSFAVDDSVNTPSVEDAATILEEEQGAVAVAEQQPDVIEGFQDFVDAIKEVIEAAAKAGIYFWALLPEDEERR